MTCAHERGAGLWARRNGDPGAYTAVVGRGQVVRSPALAGDASRLPAGAWALVEAASVLDDVPVAIDLGPGAVVGVVGPAAVAWALARSLVLQLAVTHGPADLLALDNAVAVAYGSQPVAKIVVYPEVEPLTRHVDFSDHGFD